ncbi:methyltransferase domain-containing protein [Marinimicrobium sp. ABcell2]|uniref:methyltransferase domain-containing protein n=1 Tax=Marinimicrobium sp. ABcell2 TaxID=3069751 RepID=UPI0027AE87D8|nr:methyltransferase domain-containing protein [Marinimicrobium sp. ABcell2]MDQ2075651.1 methyltransferase domain-containing protein [Marinimicrobium sp. ABcell2]
MPKQRALEDRNFDDLAARFQRNVYGGLKGKIRLAVLQRDFARHWAQPPFVPKLPNQKPLRILDAGGGQGQFSIQFAQAGHELVLCDISEEMLKLAKIQAVSAGVEERVRLVQESIQALSEQQAEQGGAFDLVLCHAVMEWVVDPQALLSALTAMVAPGGYLSLTFYNVHAMAYKNLLRGNFAKVQKQDYGGFRGSLTPINPLRPDDVHGWMEGLPLQTVCTSGIRVFHDYILDKALREQNPDQLLELELALSQQEPYRALGRYQHVLAQRLQ